MIIPPALVTKGEGQSTAGFVEVIEFLTECGFEIRGLKMVLFSQQLAEELLGVCDCVSTVKVCGGWWVCGCVCVSFYDTESCVSSSLMQI